MRRMGSARYVINEKGFVRGKIVELLHPANGIVRHGGNQVPSRVAKVGIDGGGVGEQVRLPLAGTTADEAEEIFKAQTDRPLVERACLARLEVGRVVVLAKPGRPEPLSRRIVPTAAT